MNRRFVVSPHAQGTPEWYLDRAGKATGSKASCITAQGRTKGQEATTRRDYRVQLVIERITGESQEVEFQSPYMKDGKDNEPFAVMEYEAATGRIVRPVGFCYLPDAPIGCSPDGLLEDDPEGFGFIEGKCPKPAIHLDYLERNRVPPEYVPQLVHSFYVLGAAFADFVSYCPKVPAHLRLFTVRMYRNEADLAGYEVELLRFLGEVNEMERRLQARAPLKAAA